VRPSIFDEHLPEIVVTPPGPRSRALGARLGRVECPDTTYIGADFPVFWQRAAGANVWDADGNRYIDLTAAFGVAGIGHTHPEVVEAVRAQAQRLVHGMGDVHPPALKVQLGERLAELAPGGLGVSLFGSDGSDAVEAALKTATLATDRPGCVAFAGAYHGLGYGALAATWRDDFRQPFVAQLNPHVRHLPFPDPRRRPCGGRDAADEAGRAIERLDELLAGRDGETLGAVVVEPIQGRAGVTPDLMCVGKSLGGGLPLSACIGTPEVMSAWGRSDGEARHTSTFLGNPLACAAALATLEVLRRDAWPEVVAERGVALGERLEGLRDIAGVTDVRGRGFLWGVELETPGGAPDAGRAFAVAVGALRRGVLLLADGTGRNVLAFSPPFCISEAQLDAAMAAVRAALVESEPQTGGRTGGGRSPAPRQAPAPGPGRNAAPDRAASRAGRASPGEDVETRELDAALLAWMAEAPAGFVRDGATAAERYDLDAVAAAALERRFEELALGLFAYQYERIPLYRGYSQRLGRTPSRLRCAAEVPALPVEAFRRGRVAAFPAEEERARFETSGTSARRRGTLHLDTLALYDLALERGFRHHVIPDTESIRMLLLVPGLEAAPRSSLAYMLERVRHRWGTAGSAVFVRGDELEWHELRRALGAAAAAGEPVCLLGTAFACVHVVDACAESGWRVSLPAGSRVFETGGFKGQSRELERGELCASIERWLGVPATHVVGEYGMTEMASQYYTLSLRRALLRQPPPADGGLSYPAWLRPRLVDSETGDCREPAAARDPGLLAHHDLANRGAVAHLLTADLGRPRACSFELLGRVPRAEGRGCGLAQEDLGRRPSPQEGGVN